MRITAIVFMFFCFCSPHCSRYRWTPRSQLPGFAVWSQLTRIISAVVLSVLGRARWLGFRRKGEALEAEKTADLSSRAVS